MILPMFLDEWIKSGGYTHPDDICARHMGGPENCVIHNPSTNYPLSDAPKILRESGLVEDLCPHGIGHPNMDALAYFEWIGISGLGIHGCDGCCNNSK